MIVEIRVAAVKQAASVTFAVFCGVVSSTMEHISVLTSTLFDYLSQLKQDSGTRLARSGILRNPRRLARMRAVAAQRRAALAQERYLQVPEMCFFSVTWQCNLDCVGCYAKNLAGDEELTPEEIRRLLDQMTDAGTVFFAIAGGEPLQIPGLAPMLAKSRGAFLLFTNGMLLSEADAQAIARAGNIVPVISIEGDPSTTDGRRGDGVSTGVERAMRLLARVRVPFAFSSMLTHKNLDLVCSRRWCDAMWEAGARFGFLVDYQPIPESLDPSLLLTAADRAKKKAVVAQLKAERRPFIVNFPADEYNRGGCLSAGRGFVHVNANGSLEPCTFCHYSTHNLKQAGYLEALASPFFARVRSAFSCTEDDGATCMLLSHSDEVAQIAAETGALPTSVGSTATGSTAEPDRERRPTASAVRG